MCASVGCRGWSVGATCWRVPECMCAERGCESPSMCIHLWVCVHECLFWMQLVGSEGRREGG